MSNKSHKSRPTVIVGDTLVQFEFEDNDLALFAFLGSALAEIQAFENTVGLVLAIFSSNMNKDNRDIFKFREEYFEKTLGALVNLFKKIVKDEEISNMLIDVKDKRNLLVHNILRKYGWPLMSPPDYLKCFKEIEEIRNRIFNAESKLGEYVNS